MLLLPNKHSPDFLIEYLFVSKCNISCYKSPNQTWVLRVIDISLKIRRLFVGLFFRTFNSELIRIKRLFQMTFCSLILISMLIMFPLVQRQYSLLTLFLHFIKNANSIDFDESQVTPNHSISIRIVKPWINI